MQTIPDYDYVTNAFVLSPTNSKLVMEKDYSRVSGSYSLSYTAKHSQFSTWIVPSATISVSVQNNCNNGSVYLKNVATGVILPYE